MSENTNTNAAAIDALVNAGCLKGEAVSLTAALDALQARCTTNLLDGAFIAAHLARVGEGLDGVLTSAQQDGIVVTISGGRSAYKKFSAQATHVTFTRTGKGGWRVTQGARRDYASTTERVAWVRFPEALSALNARFAATLGA